MPCTIILTLESLIYCFGRISECVGNCSFATFPLSRILSMKHCFFFLPSLVVFIWCQNITRLLSTVLGLFISNFFAFNIPVHYLQGKLSNVTYDFHAWIIIEYLLIIIL